MEKKSQIELHAHPCFEKYGLEAVIEAMDKNNLNVIALEQLNGRVFQDILGYSSDLKKRGYKVEWDDIAVKVEKSGKESYILKGAELQSRDKFHLITIGSDDVRPYQPCRKIIELALKEEALVIFSHPFANILNFGSEISKKTEKEVKNICKEYKGDIALEWNGYCLGLYWELKRFLGGKNVNKEVIVLSEKLKKEGYKVPVVTGTDVHARSKRALKAIGTARIKSDIDLTSGRRIVDSLKEKVFSGQYENTYKTVSLSHFIPYFGIPVAFEYAERMLSTIENRLYEGKGR